MYSQCTSEAEDSIRAVKGVIDGNERLRALIDSNASDSTDIASLAGAFPPFNKWKVFEHCAVITRLYAILELCVSDLVRTWLSDLPATVSCYSDLGENFHAAHRRGVAWVLQNIGRERYGHLSAGLVCRQLAHAISGGAEFEIVPEAFLYENRTLKMDRMSELLASLCIEDGWPWLCSHNAISGYLASRAGETTCDSELRSFISYRNDAAHGNTSDVLGVGPLMDYADFVLALCRALGEQFAWNRVRLMEQYRSLQPVGRITEVFKGPGAVVAIISRAAVYEGQEVAIMGPSVYRESRIKSIQDNSKPVFRVQAHGTCEVGLRFDWLPPKGCRIFDLNPFAYEI